ncbi:prepilin peptidase [Lactobacillus sp. ESL0263]|uniref:prepilin peptidase n=1 Tax=Lactobacillus sp. ESL0263 TaxID=2069350 RepID=UPI000EFB3C34|nr:A24 family peptidase [Lactobacillus sp. ESL0263]RMC48285.1 prepilin peptidase [Lactobacillus sp. ESL0263]
MNLLYQLTNFLIGTCLASHACVIAERAGKEDFIFTRSKCTNCKQQLSLLDEIPLVSYLMLKGRCRYCKVHIPCEYFLIEFLGGFAFCKIDFSSISGMNTALVLFSLLLAAISDYQSKEFDVAFIVPAFIITTIHLLVNFKKISSVDLIHFFPIFALFVYEIFKNKLGFGDLLVYLILALYFSPQFANLAFLVASIILIILFKTDELDRKASVAFIPFIYIGVITQLLYK